MPQRALRTNQSPDLPDVLLHMTGRTGRQSPNLQADIAILPAVQRLAGVLHHRMIRWSTPFDTAWPVACFTQTTRHGLRSLSTRYEFVGLGFHKQTIWNAGGGPVYYIRGDEWTAWQTAPISESMRSRGVRLWPGWDLPLPDPPAPDDLVRSSSEWLHEREWRIPRPDGSWGWRFAAADIRFLIVASAAHYAVLLQTLKGWGTEVAWVEALPVAYPTANGASFELTDALWT